MYIGLGLMTAVAAVLFAANKRLIKSLRKASDSLKETNEKLKVVCKENEDLRNFKDEYLDSINNPATVVEGQGQFSVYRECGSGRIFVANYFFNPSDPDDREYIRIHTGEVAEKLNEKP